MVTQTRSTRVIRVKEVASKLSVSNSTIWNMLKSEMDFPKPFSLSRKCTVWYEAEIDDYVLSKAALR